MLELAIGILGIVGAPIFFGVAAVVLRRMPGRIGYHLRDLSKRTLLGIAWSSDDSAYRPMINHYASGESFGRSVLLGIAGDVNGESNAACGSGSSAASTSMPLIDSSQNSEITGDPSATVAPFWSRYGSEREATSGAEMRSPRIRLVFADQEPHLRPNPRRDHMRGVPEPDGSTLDRHGGRILAPGKVVRTAGSSAPVGTIYRYDRLLVDKSVIHDDEARHRLEGAIRPSGMSLESRAASALITGQGPYRVPIVSIHGDQAGVDAWSLLQRLKTDASDESLPSELLDKVRLEHLMFCSKFVGPNIGKSKLPGSGSRTSSLERIPVDLIAPMPMRKKMHQRLRVAVLDTGVPTSHPAFDISDRSEVKDTFVVVDHAFQTRLGEHNDSAAPPLDDPWEDPDNENTLLSEIPSHFGHGTFITGLLRQMSPDVQVYSLRVIHNDGIAYEHDLLGALHHVADQIEAARRGDAEALAVDVVVLSLGYVDEDPDDQPGGWMGWAIKRLTKLGVAVVAAAGNQSSDRPFYPAAFAAHDQPEDAAPILSVGALGPGRQIALFSNDGPWVSCFASGDGLVSTYPLEAVRPVPLERRHRSSVSGSNLRDFSAGYAVWSGTSFAAPVAASYLLNAMAESGVEKVHNAVKAAERAQTALQLLKNA